jgi:hypothetical protein
VRACIGGVEQAAKILGGAVRRSGAEASPVERVEALAYLAELAEALPAQPAHTP